MNLEKMEKVKSILNNRCLNIQTIKGDDNDKFDEWGLPEHKRFNIVATILYTYNIIEVTKNIVIIKNSSSVVVFNNYSSMSEEDINKKLIELREKGFDYIITIGDIIVELSKI